MRPLQAVQNERGAVLITGLFILIALTLIGLAGMQTSTIEEKMTFNSGNRDRAFTAAEAALRNGEDYLQNASIGAFTTVGTDGRYIWSATTGSLWQGDWDGTETATTADDINTVAYSNSIDDHLGALPSQPRYYIEDLGEITSTGGSLGAGAALTTNNGFRITARGFGNPATSEVILQSIFIR